MKKKAEEQTEFSQEEHDQLCTEALYNPWTYTRKACTFKAVKTLGDNRYVEIRPIRFCQYHWHDFKVQAEDEIRKGGLLEFLIEEVVRDERYRLLQEERQQIREALRQEADEQRAQMRRVRELRDEQRRLDRDSAALAAELVEDTCVYFIQVGKRGPIKIGYTGDVLKRLDALQTGNPHRLRILATVAGTTRTEADYHRMFAAHRLSGEWFKPATEIRDEIKAITQAKRHKPGALF